MKSHFKTRKLRLESLEERALLAVTSAVFEQAAELAAPTGATNWVVNTTDDPASWDNADDILSLREAIGRAQAKDTITFDASLDGKTITLAGTELEISNGITIDASSVVGITINANQKSRVFHINISDEGAGNTVKLVSLKITGGNTDEEGGGIWNENAELTIVNSVIYGNVAEVSGGGIESSSSLTVINSTISGNSASGEDSTGGGINSLGDVTLTNTIVSFNYAVDHNNVYTTGNPPVRTTVSSTITTTGAATNTSIPVSSSNRSLKPASLRTPTRSTFRSGREVPRSTPEQMTPSKPIPILPGIRVSPTASLISVRMSTGKPMKLRRPS